MLARHTSNKRYHLAIVIAREVTDDRRQNDISNSTPARMSRNLQAWAWFSVVAGDRVEQVSNCELPPP